VIAISAAAFPSLSPDLQKATEPYITSLVFGRDIVPQLTVSTCKKLLLSMGGSDPSELEMVSGTALTQFFSSIMRSRGVSDPKLFESLDSILRKAVTQVLKAYRPKFELRSGGVVRGVTRGPEGYAIEPYEEGRELEMMDVLTGVGDHNLEALVEGLRSLAEADPNGL
jgi:hypothetical protein